MKAEFEKAFEVRKGKRHADGSCNRSVFKLPLPLR
jgi:hypothetical protein